MVFLQYFGETAVNILIILRNIVDTHAKSRVLTLRQVNKKKYSISTVFCEKSTKYFEQLTKYC